MSAPKVKHTGQESGGELCEILIVPAVKICKQCLQIDSVSETPYGGFGRGPHWQISVPQTTEAIALPNENF